MNKEQVADTKATKLTLESIGQKIRSHLGIANTKPIKMSELEANINTMVSAGKWAIWNTGKIQHSGSYPTTKTITIPDKYVGWNIALISINNFEYSNDKLDITVQLNHSAKRLYVYGRKHNTTGQNIVTFDITYSVSGNQLTFTNNSGGSLMPIIASNSLSFLFYTGTGY